MDGTLSTLDVIASLRASFSSTLTALASVPSNRSLSGECGCAAGFYSALLVALAGAGIAFCEWTSWSLPKVEGVAICLFV